MHPDPISPQSPSAAAVAEVRSDSEPMSLDGAADALARVVATAADLDELLTQTLGYERPDLLDQSPRGYDLAMARLLLAQGVLDDQQIVDALVAMRIQNFSPVPTDVDHYSRLLEMARTSEPAAATGPGDAPSDLVTMIEDHGVVPSLADLLEDRYHFAVAEGGDCFVFQAGRYVPARRFLHTVVRRLLEEGNARKYWSVSLPKQIATYLLSVAPKLWAHPGEEYINVRNGLIEVASGRLHRHDPAHLSSVQLPIIFDPAARCPGWEFFVASTFPHDARDLAFELLALTMVPNSSVQKAIMLVGPGGNGKSVYLRALTSFLGHDNVSTVPLHRLESDRFATSRLEGKLANVWADLPARELTGSSMLKGLTGGDTVIGEKKYADSYDLKPFARLVFSANTPPSTPDGDEAYFARWVVIALERSFRGTAEEVSASLLDDTLSDSSELAGALNIALAHLPAVRARGLSEPPSVLAAYRAFHAATDPVAVWLDTYTSAEPDGIVRKRLLLDAHNADARANGRGVMTPSAFGRAVRRARPGIKSAQRRLGGDIVDVWTGIALGDHTHENNEERS